MITRNTSLFDPGWWQLPGSDKRYRDWKKWGHGHLNVTKALEESADTYFYQVAYDMGIDRLSGVDEQVWLRPLHRYRPFLKSARATCQPANGSSSAFKKPLVLGDTIPVGIGQGTGLPPPSR
ncbi:hypothetical protein LNP17_08690 [Klebsiella variicola subsp. variicola]|nr:hypothetical protein [Klebsiella variicola subsp. variicola]